MCHKKIQLEFTSSSWIKVNTTMINNLKYIL